MYIIYLYTNNIIKNIIHELKINSNISLSKSISVHNIQYGEMIFSFTKVKVTINVKLSKFLSFDQKNVPNLKRL